MNITDNVIQQAVSTNSKSNVFLRDGILAGFGVRIYPTGKVSYIIEPTVNGSTKRKVIGKYPALSVSEARELAKDKIRELTSNISPVATSATFPALSVAYKDYITQIQLKPSSISEYNVVYRHYLTPLVNTPLDQVTEDMVINLYFSCTKPLINELIQFSNVIAYSCSNYFDW